MKAAFTRLWDTLVRWRTWIVNVALAALYVAPDIISAPEILALFDKPAQRWVIAAGFVLNIWLRPRPAARAVDKK